MTKNMGIRFEVEGAKQCNWQNICPARDRCNRLGANFTIGMVKVFPNSPDPQKPLNDAVQMGNNWAGKKDPDCRRRDNYRAGQPVIIVRTTVINKIPFALD